MQVQQLPIYRFLEGAGKSFVIPVYQRDYAWTKFNCQKLWNDLVDLKNNARPDHFLGTLVTIGSDYDEYTVIDGQQRLTTTSILLIALQNYLKNKEQKTSEEEVLTEQISDLLINKYSPDQDKRIRLKPNKQDKEYFENLFTNKSIRPLTTEVSNINNSKTSIENPSSNVLSNYYFFYEKINSKVLTAKDIFESFTKLKIVLISLERNIDDPQLIFESLNSTGVDLTAGDLIRNYILMDLQPKDQEKMYKTYWINIEKLTINIAEFVRNYLIFKTKTWVKKDDVYIIFKKFSLDIFKRDKEAILKDLLYFAEIYSCLIQVNKYPDSLINNQLNRLNKLEFTVSHPYLLDLFDDLKNNIISKEVVKEVLALIESYAFRKILVDNTTQGLNKMFITLSRDIKKEQTWKQDYLNILSFIILEKRISQRFPNNEEFENSLINKEIYRLQAKNRNFLLESLENYKSAYPINVDELTVEHIMPQTLTKDWKSKLGENWEQIYKRYLHTLGNLSLTAKNIELSNNSFEDKQQIDFQTSRLKLNFKLEGITTWNETTIIDRAKSLIKDAKHIWSFPKTTYVKSIPEEQVFDLTSEDDFRGTKPMFLYFESKSTENEIKVDSWRDIMLETLRFLYKLSPTQFNEIKKSGEFNWHFGINRSLRSPLEYIPNEFIEGNIFASGIIQFSRKLCERLNYPPENIYFSIRPLAVL